MVCYCADWNNNNQAVDKATRTYEIRHVHVDVTVALEKTRHLWVMRRYKSTGCQSLGAGSFGVYFGVDTINHDQADWLSATV